MSTGIIDTIKRVALNAYEASNPVKLVFGKVLSVNPVKIQISEYLTLTREYLVINGEIFEGDEVTLIRCQGGQKYVVLGTRTVTITNDVYTGGGADVSAIDKAVAWALQIASDDTHKYSQITRWGPHYDCSSFIISAYEQAGIPVKSKGGASYTGNMKNAFLSCGFKNVTSSINLKNGNGLRKGDVLLTPDDHAALVREDGGAIVQAANQKKGILTCGYYNNPWNCVLRYQG